jgi:hypothetical protein
MSKSENAVYSPEQLQDIINDLNDQNAKLHEENEKLVEANMNLEEDQKKSLQIIEDLQRSVEMAGSGTYKGFPQIDVNGEKFRIITKKVFVRDLHKAIPAEDVVANTDLLNKLIKANHGSFMTEEAYQAETEKWNTKTGKKKTLEQHLGLVK